MKKKLIGIAIALIVLVGPFRKAYGDQDFAHPMGAMVSFLAVIVGTIVVMYFFLGSPNKENQ